MAKVFFSYSHSDEDLRDELEKHLSPLRRQGIITTWHDRRIGAGDDFNGKISQNLEDADIILFLVSPDFVNSDYCYEKEVARAMERHGRGAAVVIPVILRPCLWEELPFGKLLAATKDGKPIVDFPNPDAGYLEVTKAIKKRALAIDAVKHATGFTPVVDKKKGIVIDNGQEEYPRSGNLRIKKDFSDHERDLFLADSFGYIERFFKGSLAELKKRNDAIDVSIRKINENRFFVAVYQNGAEKTSCCIWLSDGSSAFTTGIMYSYDTSGSSYSESLSVDDDGHQLHLVPTMGMHFRQVDEKLSQQGAAEYYWSKLIEPLQ